jgi:hypothetical protein
MRKNGPRADLRRREEHSREVKAQKLQILEGQPTDDVLKRQEISKSSKAAWESKYTVNGKTPSLRDELSPLVHDGDLNKIVRNRS